jgi:membrane protease YdiL (CAAX protease family)
MVATPFFTALLAGVAMLAMKGESDQVKLLQEMAHAPSGAFAVVSTMVLGLVAPIVEEMLFRGYVQRRLLERWPPAVAIAVSTLMFGAAHLDPGEGLMAAVIGVWLGIVAWRCGSIWPSIACHATQNLLFVAANRLGDADDSGDADTRPLLILLGVFAAFFVAAIWLMWRYGKKREEFDAEKDAK